MEGRAGGGGIFDKVLGIYEFGSKNTVFFGSKNTNDCLKVLDISFHVMEARIESTRRR